MFYQYKPGSPRTSVQDRLDRSANSSDPQRSRNWLVACLTGYPDDMPHEWLISRIPPVDSMPMSTYEAASPEAHRWRPHAPQQLMDPPHA